MIKKSIRNTIATGKITLPAAIFLSALMWIVTYFVDSEPTVQTTYPLAQLLEPTFLSRQIVTIMNLLLCGVVGYTLIELNNVYTVIRKRTMLHCSIYVLLVSMCPFLHNSPAGSLISLCVCLSIFMLFKSYQKNEPVGYIFHSLLFLSLGSIWFPILLFFVPLYLLSAFSFQALTLRSFFAGLIGLFVPYLGLLSYAFLSDKIDLFYAPCRNLINIVPLDYSLLTTSEYVSIIVVTFLMLVSAIHYLVTSNREKLQTRSYLNFIISLEIVIIILGIVQPQHFVTLFQLFLVGGSFLIAHLFCLSGSRLSNIFFLFSLVLITLLALYNLWMCL
ncbi:MAG: hypothetical protein RSA44_03375 [Bacteroides sp.]